MDCDFRSAPYFPYANYLSLAPPPPLASLQMVSGMMGLEMGGGAGREGPVEGEERKDPFAPEATIPLPFQLGDEYGYYGPTAIWKRNERERHRVRCVNEGYDKLRQILPFPDTHKERRLSKVETLRLAIRYIHHLEALMNDDEHHRTCTCNLQGVFDTEEEIRTELVKKRRHSRKRK